MVQQAVNDIKKLEAEVRRLRGMIERFSIGGQIIPSSVPGGAGVQMPLPIEGAILYGTGVPDWARRAPGADGEILTMVAGLPAWAANAAAGDIETFPTSETDDTLVLAPDGVGGVEWVTPPAGTPSATVEDETTFGISPDAGVSSDYSRGDHTHGTPATPGAAVFTGARVYKSTDFTHNSTGNYLPITFDTERYDSSAFHSTVSNTERLVVPVEGYYHVGGCVMWDTNATGNRLLGVRWWRADAGDNKFITLEGNVPGASRVQTVSADYFMEAGDWVELWVFQSSGGNRSVLAIPNASPEFWIHLIGE